MKFKHTCKQYGFELQLQNPLKNIEEAGTRDTNNLARVTETERPVSFPDFSETKQLIHPEYTKKKKKKRNGKKLLFWECDSYVGVICLYNKRMILVDNSWNSQCCLVNADYELLAQCKIGDEPAHVGKSKSAVMKDGTTYTEFDDYRPNSITYLKHHTATINICALKKLIFLTTDEPFRIVSEVHTHYKPFALCGLENGDLAVAWKYPWAFGILSFSRHGRYEESIRLEKDKSGRKFKSFRFLAVDESRSHVVQPCIKNQAVYCFDYQGNPVFTYTSRKLVFPQGVTVDLHGNIYVCDTRTACIHVLSHSGLGLSMILEDGQLYWPIALAFGSTR